MTLSLFALRLVLTSFAAHLLVWLLFGLWLAPGMSLAQTAAVELLFLALSPLMYVFSLTLGLKHVFIGPETFVSHDVVPQYLLPREVMILLFAVLIAALATQRFVWGPRLALAAVAAFTLAATANMVWLFKCCS